MVEMLRPIGQGQARSSRPNAEATIGEQLLGPRSATSVGDYIEYIGYAKTGVFNLRRWFLSPLMASPLS